ncbi:MAG: helix-turn-helix transcriptional regulator [Phycisphaeraceae bacterium]|nr:helix-turn-helix transcriptional regulator [Phycisphaeraceae bacterium]
MHSTAQSATPMLTAVARIAQEIERLPAVATPDWCERAAGVLIALGDCAACGIVNIDPVGRVVAHQAAGAAVSEASERGVPAVLRSNLLSVAGVGIDPRPVWNGRTVCGAAGELAGGEAWRSGPIGVVWQGAEVGEPVVGLAPILAPRGNGAPLASVYALIARRDDAPPRPESAALLRAALPLIAERARIALTPDGAWLTEREQEILEALTHGLSVREIAQALSRSPHTVHDHVKSLHRKLKAHTRGELVARALGRPATTRVMAHRKSDADVPLSNRED